MQNVNNTKCKSYQRAQQRVIEMYTLLHGLYKYLVQKDEYFILILGLDNAGKTVFILEYCDFRGYDTRNSIRFFQTYLEAAKTKFTKNYKGMNPSKITTTVGLNIGKIDIAGVSFNFWDLGGQEELQSLWDKVINNKINTLYIVYFHSCLFSLCIIMSISYFYL